MGLIRKHTEKEIGLVSYLANKANYKLQPNWLENLDIMPLDDGGMGSIIFFQANILLIEIILVHLRPNQQTINMARQ